MPPEQTFVVMLARGVFRTIPHNNKQRTNMKLLCHLDWLEVYCRRSTLDPPTNAPHLIAKLQPYTTRVYSHVYNVTTDFGVPVATATTDPLSRKSDGGILLDNIMHIKIANYWLYTDKWMDMLQQVLDLFSAEVINISRIDVCGDWQYAANGCPAYKMLHNLAVGKYRKVFQPNWHLHAKSKETLHYNSIGFGSKSSPVFTRFYNKTLELSQATDKPYIRELWKQYGFSDSADVYRTEFSLTGIGKSCVDGETGEVLTVSLDDVSSPKGVTQLFVHWAQRYFDIRVYDNERSNRCTPIKVFPDSPKPYIPLRNPRYATSTRTDRTILNRLMQYLLSNEYDEGDAQAMLYLIKDICDSKNLWDWLGHDYNQLQQMFIDTFITEERQKRQKEESELFPT